MTRCAGEIHSGAIRVARVARVYPHGGTLVAEGALTGSPRKADGGRARNPSRIGTRGRAPKADSTRRGSACSFMARTL